MGVMQISDSNEVMQKQDRFSGNQAFPSCAAIGAWSLGISKTSSYLQPLIQLEHHACFEKPAEQDIAGMLGLQSMVCLHVFVSSVVFATMLRLVSLDSHLCVSTHPRTKRLQRFTCSQAFG